MLFRSTFRGYDTAKIYEALFFCHGRQDHCSAGGHHQAVLSGKKAHIPRKKVVAQAEPPKVNLLVDIQAKLQAGKGAGYARWAKVFNLKQMAQTMNYLSENNLLELSLIHICYRARTRFSKFFNLPELMNLFKEVADIKTADQLNLPTPEVEYHNIVAQPTEHQQEMVKALSERASEVHRGSVDPSVDNMLKITSDGRKLGLDQRIVNQLLPDEPGTKVNQCVDNIMQIWQDGEADKLTQLVFCDISTPQAKAPASKAAKTLDNPLLHALEGAVPLPEQEQRRWTTASISSRTAPRRSKRLSFGALYTGAYG